MERKRYTYAPLSKKKYYRDCFIDRKFIPFFFSRRIDGFVNLSVFGRFILYGRDFLRKGEAFKRLEVALLVRFVFLLFIMFFWKHTYKSFFYFFFFPKSIILLIFWWCYFLFNLFELLPLIDLVSFSALYLEIYVFC